MPQRQTNGRARRVKREGKVPPRQAGESVRARRGWRNNAAMRTPINDLFHKFAHQTAEIVGTAWAFICAVVIILLWLISGPFFGFSDTWQLIINTGTTIVTFLIVFLIQNSQNRDARAIHLKLDELIRALQGPRTRLVDLEDMSEADLKSLQEEFKRIRELEKDESDSQARFESPRKD